MSSYGVIWPSFWDSRTGRALVADLRDHGRFEPLVLALYLMTTKHANLLGCFALPRIYIAHDTGLNADQMAVAIARLIDLEFIEWDSDLEFIWIRESARVRLNLGGDDPEPPSQKDNRVIACQRIYDTIPSLRLANGIFERYGQLLRLRRRVAPKPLASPLEGASKGSMTARGTVQVPTVQNSTEKSVPRARRVDKGPEHRGHAFCSDRYCVPQGLHDEFVGQVGGANIALLAWYMDVVTALGDKPCTTDTFKFWKAKFQKEIVPRLKVAGAIDMLPPRPIDRMNERLRSATRSAPITKRTFKKGEQS